MAPPPFVPRIEQSGVRTVERSVSTTAAAVMANGTTVFNVVGVPIVLTELVSFSTTVNDATASTVQWSADGDIGAATAFTGASASLANAAAGTALVCNLTATSTAPDIVPNGVGLAGVKTRGIIIPVGIITMVVGVGSTTGRWIHYLRYQPLMTGGSVQPAF